MESKQYTWIKNHVEFERNEEFLSVAVYHKNPNVAQVLIWRAMSFGLTAKYHIILTNKRVMIRPMNNELTLTRHEIMSFPYKEIRIFREDGAIEVNCGEKKPLRIYPDTLINRIDGVNMTDFKRLIRIIQKMNIQESQRKVDDISIDAEELNLG